MSLTLKVGTYYKTRGGGKAYVAGKNPFPHNEEDCSTFAGFIYYKGRCTNTSPQEDHHYNGTSDVMYWDSEGQAYLEEETTADLIEEWREPIRIKKTFYLKCFTSGKPFISKTRGGPKVLGSTTVELIEGQFAEEE
jgi:hypothetical protein